ncbi:hypothetical protein AMTR_s00019p00227610 [Amborella trichopoda]|uniref:Uncharacterized protein n=1 Tax=Amborella trichopoda TaxID=13333 RepID=W1PBP1_AMBTC|nr:hypothetical protein AMTR_s00019p00227610 [Amborella trichopoda]
MGAGVIAMDVDQAVSICGQAPCQREEVREAVGKRGLDGIEHRVNGQMGLAKEETVLDIVGRKHGQVPWCEVVTLHQGRHNEMPPIETWITLL